MPTPDRSACRYLIVLRGECRTLLAGVLDGAQVDAADGETFVTASVRDESELYGLLDRLRELALHIVRLDELGPAA